MSKLAINGGEKAISNIGPFPLCGSSWKSRTNGYRDQLSGHNTQD